MSFQAYLSSDTLTLTGTETATVQIACTSPVVSPISDTFTPALQVYNVGSLACSSPEFITVTVYPLSAPTVPISVTVQVSTCEDLQNLCCLDFLQLITDGKVDIDPEEIGPNDAIFHYLNADTLVEVASLHIIANNQGITSAVWTCGTNPSISLSIVDQFTASPCAEQPINSISEFFVHLDCGAFCWLLPLGPDNASHCGPLDPEPICI